MKTLNSSTEFVVGKNGIGYIDSDFNTRFPNVDFTPKTQAGSFQTLTKRMTDAEIESELKPGLCDLGDVYAFLQNPPEGTKDGNWNLFYTPSFVVSVRWYSYDSLWRVFTWARDGSGWGTDERVFSPATVASETQPFVPLESSDSLTLAIKICQEQGLIVSRPL